MTYNLLKMKTDEDAVAPSDGTIGLAAANYAEHLEIDGSRISNREVL